jgi:DNA-binding transcriptional regulator GbsR (MarR family)
MVELKERRNESALKILRKLENPDAWDANSWRVRLMIFEYLTRKRYIGIGDVELQERIYLKPDGINLLEKMNYDFYAKDLSKQIMQMAGLCNVWGKFEEMCALNNKGNGKIDALEIDYLRELARKSKIVTAVSIWKKIIHYGWRDPNLPDPFVMWIKITSACVLCEKIQNLGSPYFGENAKRELSERMERTGETLKDMEKQIDDAYTLFEKYMRCENRPAPFREDVAELVRFMDENGLSYEDLGKCIKKELNENLSVDDIHNKMDECGEHIAADCKREEVVTPSETDKMQEAIGILKMIRSFKSPQHHFCLQYDVHKLVELMRENDLWYSDLCRLYGKAYGEECELTEDTLIEMCIRAEEDSGDPIIIMQ